VCESWSSCGYIRIGLLEQKWCLMKAFQERLTCLVGQQNRLIVRRDHTCRSKRLGPILSHLFRLDLNISELLLVLKLWQFGTGLTS